MLTVAVTGPIASGKSSVARLFEAWGATRLDADTIVRELQRPGQPVLQAIVHRFGRDVLAADGSLDRAALRALVLDDARARADLNGIVHPAVYAELERRLAELAAAGTAVAVVEVPLLFETGRAGHFDRVVIVQADADLQCRRLMETRGLDRETARRFIAAQQPLPDGTGALVVRNEGSRELLEQRARAAWRELVGGA